MRGVKSWSPASTHCPACPAATPKGVFYAFPNIKRAAIIGGPDFGIFGEGYVRLSYANSTENIVKALERMGEFLATRKAA